MDILFISCRFPTPTGRGDQVRGFHQIRLLSREHRVTLLAPSASDDVSEQPARELCHRVATVVSSPARSLLRLPKALVTGTPIQNQIHYDPRLGREAARLVRQMRFDVVHVQLIRAGAAIEQIRGSVPVLLDMIDALSLNLTRRAGRSRGLVAAAARHEAARVATYERYILGRTDRAVISSEVDRASIGSHDHVSVVPNGIDLRVDVSEETARHANRIVFAGTMNYFPNIDAVIWFVRDVLPLIQRSIPAVELDIIGPTPTGAVRALQSNPAVRVLGFVPSVMDHIASACVSVAPMRSGSGTQFKVLEAMAIGTPVVATPLAVAGLTALPSLRLHVAESAEEFAREVCWILENPRESATIATATMLAVRSAYSWETSVHSLLREYSAAIAAASARGVRQL